MNTNDTSSIDSEKNVVIGTNANANNGIDNVVIGYSSTTKSARGTIIGSMSSGTSSGGAALGDHVKVGNTCVSVGSYSNTDNCYMGIAIGYQANTSNVSEDFHTNTAYSFCAGMGSRIKSSFCVGIGRGIYVEDACGHSIVLGGYAKSEVQNGIVIASGQGSGPAPVTATASYPVWFGSPGLTSGEMMLAGQPFYDFSAKKLNTSVIPMDYMLNIVGRLLVNLGLDEKRTMDIVAALTKEIEGNQSEVPALSKISQTSIPERSVPLEPYELE